MGRFYTREPFYGYVSNRLPEIPDSTTANQKRPYINYCIIHVNYINIIILINKYINIIILINIIIIITIIIIVIIIIL